VGGGEEMQEELDSVHCRYGSETYGFIVEDGAADGEKVNIGVPLLCCDDDDDHNDGDDGRPISTLSHRL